MGSSWWAVHELKYGVVRVLLKVMIAVFVVAMAVVSSIETSTLTNKGDDGTTNIS